MAVPGMFDVPVALALGAGMLATVNPCGFAILPAYLGFFVGSDDDERAATAWHGRWWSVRS